MHQGSPLALAFSGGLDTSYCVPRLAEEGWAVHTVYVNTGGAGESERAAIRRQAEQVGAVQHHEVDARAQVYNRFVRFLIQGNVLRGEVYPLSVAAERTQQALSVAEVARRIGARAVAHGSTGAGNDQVRFDVALRVLATDLEIVTPIRDAGVKREAAIAYLQRLGLPVPAKAGAYSINRGLWGTTWGGGWTHDTWAGPPAELIDPPADAPPVREIVLAWEQGLPVSLDGAPVAGPELVARLGDLAEAYGIGRNIHVGETALGIKGRIGFEAGAALLLISAHRELEKLVLTKWQVFWKDQLGRFYGDRLHEGQYFDPALRDIEALINSSQSRVTGDTRVRLAPGRFQVVGTRSPHSMMDTSIATYGEENRLWTGDEARAFARVAAVPSLLAARAADRESLMVVTTRVRLDRISSSTRNAALSPEVIVGDQIVSAEGYVLAVRILEDKPSYNTIEDVTGRMLALRAGDVLAGVLGTRRALRGYAGIVPTHLAVGDTIEVLNLGGILGRCTSVNPEIGPPFRAELLGAVLAFPELGDRVGRPAHIRDRAVPPADLLESRVPVIYVAGTCMNAGKTVAATELVRGLARGGLRVAAAKLTGVSLMRDALSMLDAGAIAALTFNDVGIASTHAGVTVTTAKGIFNRLAAAKPDVIVAELGDGILGEYGVQDILHDGELMRVGAAYVMAAPDPVACWGAAELMQREFDLPITAITGPATDNEVGQVYITGSLGLPAHNALRDAAGLLGAVRRALDAWSWEIPVPSLADTGYHRQAPAAAR